MYRPDVSEGILDNAYLPFRLLITNCRKECTRKNKEVHPLDPDCNLRRRADAFGPADRLGEGAILEKNMIACNIESFQNGGALLARDAFDILLLDIEMEPPAAEAAGRAAV